MSWQPNGFLGQLEMIRMCKESLKTILFHVDRLESGVPINQVLLSPVIRTAYMNHNTNNKRISVLKRIFCLLLYVVSIVEKADPRSLIIAS